MISINQQLGITPAPAPGEFKKMLLQLKHYRALCIHAAGEMREAKNRDPARMVWLTNYYTRMRGYVYFQLMETINRKTPPAAVVVGDLTPKIK